VGDGDGRRRTYPAISEVPPRYVPVVTGMEPKVDQPYLVSRPLAPSEQLTLLKPAIMR
jgi:hypothetical protein